MGLTERQGSHEWWAGVRRSGPRRLGGFATMDPARAREISSKGGKAVHAAGTGHKFTSEEAREAGRKGGKALWAKRHEADKDNKLTVEVTAHLVGNKTFDLQEAEAR